MLPAHKPWLVLQGSPGEFYVDHVHPFGAACASSNAGMIANALVDVWRAEGVSPLLKYEDDLNAFRYPVEDGSFIDGQYRYAYDRDDILRRVAPLNVPWHPEKGDPFFSSMTTFIGLSWDLALRHVSLPEPKRLKFLARVETFINSYSGHRCQLRDVERLHGSLCYIAFVYVDGRSRLPSLSNFAASFKGDEFTFRYPPPSVLTDLRWWHEALIPTGTHRQLMVRGPVVDMGISVDASTSWGIGIIVKERWLGLKLAPSWKVEGRDICWLETIAVELVVYILETMGVRNSRILIHSDNQGTIGSMHKGRSPNYHINLSIRRTYNVLSSLFITPELEYIASALNPADPISRGETGPLNKRLHTSFKLPEELHHVFTDADWLLI